MDIETLVKILKQEEIEAASYYDSEIASEQAEAMDRFNAAPYADDTGDPNRSRVVSHDIENTINWLMPHLMRVVLQSDELLTCDDTGLEDGDETLNIAADYLSHVIFKDNAGEEFLHDFCFDALLQKIAVSRVYWEAPQPKPPRIVEGVTIESLHKYQNDPEYEITEAEQQENSINGQPYTTWNIKVKRTPLVGRGIIECIPPEEFRVSKRARSLKEADYHAWARDVYLAEVIREFPDHRAELDPDGEMSTSPEESEDQESDPRAHARFPEEDYSDQKNDGDLGTKKAKQMVEYIRCDFDGDGIVELRRIRRIGDVILENDAVEESEFSSWSPIRVAHRLIGRSLADTLIDLQRIQTVLTRSALDGLGRTLMPRTVVNKRLMSNDGSTLDQIVDHAIGGVIEVDGPVSEAIREIVSPDVSGSALQAIEYFDQQIEEASGVTRHAQGLSPQAITKTKGGIEMLQAAANSRVEMIARWMAIGLQETFSKLLRILILHHDAPRVMKISGRQMEVDPRRWSDDMTVSVHVGMAAESRDRRLTHLNIIAEKQEAVLMQAGPDNPLVGMKEYRHTLAQMIEAMGYKSPNNFVKEIRDDDQQPEPKADPAQIEAEQKMKLAQVEIQGKQKLAQQQVQITADQAQQKAETDQRIAEMKLSSERDTAAMRVEMEREMAIMRLAQEKELALIKMDMEAQLAHENPKAAKDANGGNGFRPGGQLNA